MKVLRLHKQATETQEAMDQHYKAKWQQAEADLTALCQSNSAQVQSFASKMHETNEEHQKLHDAQERQLQLEAQTLREAHQYEQQAAQSAQDYQNMIQELRRQADEQPDIQKLLWKKQLSQQAAYRSLVKVPSPSGDRHAKTFGSQAVAHKAIIVQGIIRDANQAGAQSAALLSMSLHSVLAQ